MTKLYKNYINGGFVDENMPTVDVFNPANGELLAKIPDSDEAMVGRAIEAAKRAQPVWEKIPAIERASFLRKMATKLRENRKDFAKIIWTEQGKTQQLSLTEVDFTADYFDYMAEWARRIEGEILTSDRPNENIFLFRKPIGVVAGILPWNFPIFLIARKVGPALVTGNTIVIKPSEETPIGAFEFARLVDEIGLPKGVFNLVGGRGQSTGEALANNPDVGLVTFTGSVATGSRIMQAAGQNLTRVNLELGGKAPAIVLADADLDLTAKALHASRMINTGQACNCAERVYVESSVHDELVDRLQKLFANTRYGDPSLRDDLDMGPLINRAAVDRADALVKQAKSGGATIVTGGKPADIEGGFHFEPTLITGVQASMDVMRKEAFAPVLPIQTVGSLEEAIDLANDSEYGLTSSIFTQNLNSAMRAARDLRFGETYINREHFEAMQGFHAGRRKSGIGGADGKHGLYEFTETHVVYLQTP